jgi:hypothetical protein
MPGHLPHGYFLGQVPRNTRNPRLVYGTLSFKQFSLQKVLYYATSFELKMCSYHYYYDNISVELFRAFLSYR